MFNDATLCDLAREQPTTPEALLRISGIGLTKLEHYGEEVLHQIRKQCRK